jgi:methylated-DNA-[protein]-cysteine S-methyltransferase
MSQNRMSTAAAQKRTVAAQRPVASQASRQAPKFSDRVYALLRQVPEGKVTTYKDIAHALGTGAYRSVGQALRCNPYAPAVPCHRVVASDGSIGGFMGARSGPPIRRKIALLRKEGVMIKDNRVVGFEQRRYTF